MKIAKAEGGSHLTVLRDDTEVPSLHEAGIELDNGWVVQLGEKLGFHTGLHSLIWI